MKTLIVEDEFMARNLLKAMLAEYSDCDIAVNSTEVMQAVKQAYSIDRQYDLICLDIFLESGPDGLDILKAIREFESVNKIHGNDRIKIIMITANDKPRDIMEAFSRGECDAYMVKPVLPEKLEDQLKQLGLH